MNIDVALLKKICETAGAPGFEKQIRNLIIEVIKPYVDEYHVDNLGNLDNNGEITLVIFNITQI